MRRVQFLLALALAAALAGPLAAQTAQPSGALAGGIEHFQAGQYDQALISFRGIVLSQADDPQKPAAYFWLAKTLLAAGRLDDAARNLEFYLANWPKAADRAEAVYLQGRVLNQQEDFEAAIRVFQSFLAAYPASPFAANAWFWSAESLYGLGRLEEASVLYQKVIREYPMSAKVEAAQYKASLIGLKQREQELSRLLKWSHEEFLRTIEEYQRRQESSDQLIEALQKRLAGGGAGATGATAAASTAASDKALAELRAELEKKNAEASALAARISELEGQLAVANEALTEAMMTAAAASAAGTAETERLLAAKAEALTLKELLLDWLEGKGAQP
ncbi:MAG: tetratricopeptide repeat protein [Spirochaetes bacterium]|nr:tetratricopeptide repeat protein [Spirochaetota bacterium]